MTIIVHITTGAEWESAQRKGEYRAPSLAAEGFIHCSTLGQTVETANRFYRGVSDLVLLLIDEDRVSAQLLYEPPAGGSHANPNDRFPHVFGPLNLDAVVKVTDFPPNADGTFTLPESLTNLP